MCSGGGGEGEAAAMAMVIVIVFFIAPYSPKGSIDLNTTKV